MSGRLKRREMDGSFEERQVARADNILVDLEYFLNEICEDISAKDINGQIDDYDDIESIRATARIIVGRDSIRSLLLSIRDCDKERYIGLVEDFDDLINGLVSGILVCKVSKSVQKRIQGAAFENARRQKMEKNIFREAEIDRIIVKIAEKITRKDKFSSLRQLCGGIEAELRDPRNGYGFTRTVNRIKTRLERLEGKKEICLSQFIIVSMR